jgi:peptidoglycan/LPS O-acetylase OafA/YrhL
MASATTPNAGVGATYRGDSETTARERMLSMLAGLLGLAVFAIGFLRWLSVGDGDDQSKYSGFAFQMPTTAIIGLSLAAGLIAWLGATERRRGRGVPSAIPTGLAAASLLLAIGVFLGKGAISPSLGDEIGVEIGLILAILATAVQTAVLAAGLASRHDDSDYDNRTRR